MSEKNRIISEQVRDLKLKMSELREEMEHFRLKLEDMTRQKEFYQLVADFTNGWELWLDPDGRIRYCSPSCLDITGFSANEIIMAESPAELLVFETDREKFNEFMRNSADQLSVSRSFEFRIMTRHRQLRWGLMNTRGVYNLQGRYLGIRASIQDITKLKRALGHIHDLSAGKEMETKAKTRLKSELDQREREQVSYLLQLSQKNELISGTIRKIKGILADKQKKIRPALQELLHSMEMVTPVPVHWQAVTAQTETLHPGFLRRLEMKHPSLNVREKKLAVFIRLGMTSKEIAGLQFISPKSVETARVRLRKKLKLTEKLRLSDYIGQI